MSTQQALHNGNGSSVLADALKGAVAGAIGVWVLDKVTWAIWDRQKPATLAREEAARPGGLDPAHVVANRLARAVGTELEPAQPHPAGLAVHYAIGVVPAALYAVARKRSAMVKPGFGVLLGLGLFVLQDEIVNPILRSSGGPTEYPWQAHARGLVGHLAFGAATELALVGIDELV